MKTNIDVDFWWVAFVVVLIAFHGEPDLVDATVYKLTGVWQTSSGLLRLDQ